MVENCSAPEVHLLGEIVVAWGTLELTLEVTLAQLLTGDVDTSQRGRSYMMAMAMTSGMSFKQKVEALKRVYPASMFQQKETASAKSDLKALVKDLFNAEQERNKFMHSAWNYHPDGSFVRMKAINDKPLRSFHRMPAKRIEAVLDQIIAASTSLAIFTIKYIQKTGLALE